MKDAGLDAHIDPLGTVAGRLEGTNPEAPALLIGSHIDTVVDAGRYDGTLGVVLGIVVIEALRQLRIAPSCPIEIVAFGDEENARFPTNLSTSQAFSGRYDPAWLDGKDQDGVTLREALAAFGGDPRGSMRSSAIERAIAAISKCISNRGRDSKRPATRSASCRPSPEFRAPAWRSPARRAMPAPYR